MVESFAMGTDTVLVSACNSGCMALHGSTLFICWDVVGLRLYAYCCLYSTMDTEARHRVCIWNVVCAITFDEESFGVGTDTLLVFTCNND